LTLPRELNPKGSIVYDLEDAEVSSTYASAATPVLQHTTRNELSGVNQTTQFADGVGCTPVNVTCMFDSRSGQMLEQQTPSSVPGVTATLSHTYAYDAAGRETADTLSCGVGTTPMTATRSYDTDNHIVAQTLPAMFNPVLSAGTCPSQNNQELLNYTWGADGRLANLSTTGYYPGQTPSQVTNTQSAHWDGDDLLYVSYEGTMMMLYVEKLGVIGQSSNATNTWGFMVYDRDQTGTAVNEHFSVSTTSAGFSPLTVDNIHPFRTSCSAKTSICSVSGLPASPSVGGPAGPDPYQTPQTLLLDATREDGYFDGTLSLQGARAYDPNMNQWTTPDAYAGDVHDPMSQHPYMWNNNNPVQYSDPSGYDTCGNSGSHDHKEDCGSAKNLQTIVTVKACARTCVSDAVNELQNKFSPDSANGVIGTLAFMIPGGEGAGAVEGAAARELSGSALTLSKTVAGHAASRPYVNSRFLVEEIMRAKAPVPDPGGLPGGLRWDVPGTFNSSSGTYQLVVDPATKQIVHFLFTSTP
jgi:RHS repeat-associated protein